MIEVTELPLTITEGRLFRSLMPYRCDRGELLDYISEQGVDTVVMLCSDQECLASSGRNLRQIYREHGWDVIYLPTPNLAAPEPEALDEALSEACERLQAGRSLLVHCAAGLGRTGAFAACLMRRLSGCDAREAIAWIRDHVPGAVETPDQVELITNLPVRSAVSVS